MNGVLRTSLAGAAAALLLFAGGCGLLLRLDEFTDGAANGGGATGGSGGQGGAGATQCNPGTTAPCYTGPADTEGVGLCRAGSRTCLEDGSAYGECVGEILPRAEDCAGAGDEDCDGTACGEPLWAYWLGSIGTPMGSALDAEGNLLLTGIFRGTILPAPHTLSAGSNDHYFLAKFSPQGVVVWAQQFGLVGSPGYDIRVAVHRESGTILLAGNLLEDTDFGGGALTAPTNGNWGMFVAAFDSDGSHRWSKAFGSSADFQRIRVAATSGGDAIISGSFYGTANLGAGTFTSTASYDAFLLRLDRSDGSHQWSHSIGDVSGSQPQDQSIDALGSSAENTILLGGMFTTSIALGGTASLTHQGRSGYLARLSASSGFPYWTRKLPGASISASASDEAGNAFFTGYIEGPVDFGGGVVLEPSGNKDVFAAKYGETGAHHWSKRFGEVNDNQGLQVGVGPEDSVVLVGTASGAIHFGGAPLTGQPPSDIFVAKLGALGGHQWSRLYGDASAETPHTMNVDPLTGEVIIAGRSESALNIGGWPVEQGMFIIKMAP